MRSSIFIVFAFLSCATAARVKVRSHSRFSARGDSCKVLAKWICQPKTYEQNLGQVKECCKSSNCGSEELRQTCCQLAGMEDDGVNNVTAVRDAKKLVEEPMVVEKAPENIVEDIGTDEDLTEEVLDVSPKTSVDYELFSELVQQLWVQSDIQPNLEKEMMQAFYVSKKSPKLSWSISCVAQCEAVDGGDSCESLGGQCQAVQTKEDCEAAGVQLSKSFFAYDPNKGHMATEMERFPRGCFVKVGKTNTNIVRWNPPRSGENVKLNNVCGCYKDK